MTDPRLHFADRMSDADALVLALEADPVLRSTIVSAWILDRTPDPARLAAKLERATRLIPRLRQKAVRDPLGLAPPRWEEDASFDLRFHVRRARLPEPGGERQLLDLAEPVAMQAFDMDRPLWEVHLVEGLADGRSAVLMKLHHTISDGMGLVRMTECLVERGPEDTGETTPLPERAPAAVPTGWERTRDALAHRLRARLHGLQRLGAAARRDGPAALRDPFGALRQVGETLGSTWRLLAPADAPLSGLMRRRSKAVRFDAFQIPLEPLKRAGKAVGGSLNDAFVAAIGGGLARYHAALGEPVERLRMMMPINTRSEDTARLMGNQFAPVRFEVPVGIADPATRMREVRARVLAQRREPALPWVEDVSGALGTLPPSLALWLFGEGMKTVDFTTSNVPGPRRATWMSGAKVERFLPFGPLAGAGANITVFSYDGAMHVGVNSDPAAVTDPALLLECLRKGVDEVLQLA